MDRIEELVSRLETVEPASVREDARALVTEVLAFHAEGLRRLVETLRRRDPRALDEASKDPLVASLFELHDLREDAALVPASDLLKKKTAAVAKVHGEENVPCDLCAAPAASRHAHLFDVDKRELRCVCQACSIVMATNERLRRVPERSAAITSLADDDAWWTSMGLPIGIAFFVQPAPGAREVEVQYPGAAGTVVSSVPIEIWTKIAEAHPQVRDLEPHVEVLLVNRTWGAREHWIVGIDRAYELAGLVRERWRGFTGGDEVRAALKGFFAGLAQEERSS